MVYAIEMMIKQNKKSHKETLVKKSKHRNPTAHISKKKSLEKISK